MQTLLGSMKENFRDKIEPVTSVDILLVQKSFTRLTPISGTFTDIFFTKFFEFEPLLKKHYASLPPETARVLFYSAGYLIQNLHNLEVLNSLIYEYAKKLQEAGILSSQFESIGKALLYAISKTHGSFNSFDLRAAWIRVYSLIVRGMKQSNPMHL